MNPLTRSIRAGLWTGFLCLCLVLARFGGQAAERDIDSQPPVVVKTIPEAGLRDVPPGVFEIQVTFSKEMKDGSWSWAGVWQGSTPEVVSPPKFAPNRRTCVLSVRLEPGRTYAYWLNSEQHKNFKDIGGRPSVPYLLAFKTADKAGDRGAAAVAAPEAGNAGWATLLKPDQRRVLAWTDRQFRNFFDHRSFDGWSADERSRLEARLLEALSGPVNPEYYTAIGSLAALRATNAIPKLRELAFDRRDKNNRDRWMALRALGLIGDRGAIPEMIHLVYHGNVNSRWWAQIALVQLTGQNFGRDWEAWGNWWNASGGQPRWQPELIRWWTGQAEPDQLAASLQESDAKFLSGLPPGDGDKVR